MRREKTRVTKSGLAILSLVTVWLVEIVVQDQSKAKPKQCRIIFDTQLKSALSIFSVQSGFSRWPREKGMFCPRTENHKWFMLWLKQDKGIVVINWDTSAFKFAIFISWKMRWLKLNTDQSSCIRDKKKVLAVFYHNNASYICFTDVLEEWLALNSSMFILIRVMTSKTAQKCARLEELGQYKAVQTPRRVSSIFFIIIFSKVQPIFRWR